MKKTESLIWVNAVKGLGIICIVVGHINIGPVKDFLYTFHVPLFFFLSGYLFKDKNSFSQLAFSKFTTLMVPYFAYLFFLTVFMMLKEIVAGGEIYNIKIMMVNALYGGKALTGWFSVFWFITSLFFTQLACYFLIKLPVSKLVFVSSMLLSLAYLQAHIEPELSIIWSLNTVLYCIPIFMVGYLYRQLNIEVNVKALTTLFLIALGVYFSFPALFYIDIKESIYGLPIASFTVSMIFVLFVFETLKTASRYINFGALAKLGVASMSIMYLHQPIQITLRHQIGVKTEILVISSTLIVCLLLHLLLVKNKFTQKLFLGFSK